MVSVSSVPAADKIIPALRQNTMQKDINMTFGASTEISISLRSLRRCCGARAISCILQPLNILTVGTTLPRA